MTIIVRLTDVKCLRASVNVQMFFLFAFGALFNLIAVVIFSIFKGESLFRLFHGHSFVTMLLVVNNALQGIVSSFFFKYADTILKKYSSTLATIITGVLSAVLFGHHLTLNFAIGVSIVFISMHQFFSSITKKAIVNRSRPETPMATATQR
jgi:hypothetical protein